MDGKLKNCLKHFLPPTIHIFNQEVNALRGDIKDELSAERESRQKELASLIGQEKEEWQRELREQLSLQSAELINELELRLSDFKNELDERIETLGLLGKDISEKLLELQKEQNQGKDQTISALWDSRNSALWENKEEMRIYNRQWQQILWYWLAAQNGVSLSQEKEAFFKALPKAEGSVRLIQEMELYLLSQFARLCAEYGLKYWLTDGSLLGAVRHEGFVPWDDDMDVGMPRVDFERLKEALKDNEHFRIVDYYCLFEPRWFSKISKFVELDSGSSVFIDLFPYDYYDAETLQEARAQYHERRAGLVSELEKLIPTLKCRYQDVQVEDPEDKAALDEVFAKFVSGYPKSGQWMGWSVEIWESEARIGFPKDVIFPCGERIFEGLPVSVPADADAWLQQVYGEYMEFPRDVGIQNHMKMFGIDQQEEQIRAFLQQRTAWEENCPQGMETEDRDGSGQTSEASI